jgi:hypothetical protein
VTGRGNIEEFNISIFNISILQYYAFLFLIFPYPIIAKFNASTLQYTTFDSFCIFNSDVAMAYFPTSTVFILQYSNRNEPPLHFNLFKYSKLRYCNLRSILRSHDASIFIYSELLYYHIRLMNMLIFNITMLQLFSWYIFQYVHISIFPFTRHHAQDRNICMFSTSIFQFFMVSHGYNSCSTFE